MGTVARGQGGPARTPSTLHPLDRELLELERRKLVELRAGRITLTRDGYAELVRRGLVRNGSGRRS